MTHNIGFNTPLHAADLTVQALREKPNRDFRLTEAFAFPDTVKRLARPSSSVPWTSEILELPFLDPAFCAELIRLGEHSNEFNPNLSDGRFGSLEAALRNVSADIERLIVEAVIQSIAPLTWDFWGYFPTVFAPPFLTRYSAAGIPGIPVHHDFQSDVTITIPLNDDFQGGGLHFPRQGIVTALHQVGWAIIFPGRVTHPHQALPIVSGQRYVLTLWTRHGDAEGRAA